jgi:hypothetical protein
MSCLDVRVRRLERMVRTLTAALVVVSTLLLLGARRPNHPADLIQARRIQIVDETGVVRTDLRHDAEETGLFILDDHGDTRIGIAQFAHGGGGVALHGPAAKGAAVLYLKNGGSLTIYDTTGAVTARFPTSRR